MKAQLTLGAVVGLVLLLIVLMSLHDWTVSAPVQPAVLEQAPLIASQGISGRMFDEAGNVRYALKAATANEYDFSQQLQLTDPQVEIFSGGDHWVVNAKQGSMQRQNQQANREIVLKDDVQAHLLGSQTASVATDELHYFPATEELQSPGSVVVRQQQNVIRAGQMQADLKAGKILLSKGVESRYAVPAS